MCPAAYSLCWRTSTTGPEIRSAGSSGIVASARAVDVFAGPTFGTIWGLMTLAVGPGEALGTWLGGWIFDATGSYLPAFGVALAALVAGVDAIWRVPSTPGGAGRS